MEDLVGDRKAYVIPHGNGRFGNQLFYAALTFVRAAQSGRPVRVREHESGWGLAELPCLRSTPGLMPGLPEEVLTSPWFQDLHLFGKEPESFFPMLREIFTVQPLVSKLRQLPGPNDLVLYFRSFNEADDDAEGCINEFKGRTRLANPPLDFFALQLITTSSKLRIDLVAYGCCPSRSSTRIKQFCAWYVT